MEISDSIGDIYGIQLSATMISNITDAVLEEIEKWILFYNTTRLKSKVKKKRKTYTKREKYEVI